MFGKDKSEIKDLSSFDNISKDGKVFGGREVTKISTAKRDFYDKNTEIIDPRPYIEKGVSKGMNFYGFYHNGENEGQPCFLPTKEVTMEFFTGSTGTGKGIFAGNKIYENCVKGKGTIIIDPKKDDFTTQVANEAAEKYNRYFNVAYWPSNFGYSGINEDDNSNTISNKMIPALGIEESENPGVEYYRGNERVTLKKVLKLFFDGSLGVIVKKDFKEIVKHIQHLKTDLEKSVKWDIESSKMRPNIDILSKLEKRFYDTDKVNKIYWSDKDIESLDSLSLKLSEISDNAFIHNGIDMEEVLYNGGVVILKVDLLDNGSLKMIKMLFGDLLERGRKRKCNVHVLADEASFYATRQLSASLAVKRGLGVDYSIWVQEVKQLNDEVRDPIMSNCNIKGFYKSSNIDTLDYISKVSGKVPVTSISSNKEKGLSFSQILEDNLNVTMVRAFPRVQVMALVAEFLNTTEIVRTNFIPVKHPFDWNVWEFPKEKSINDKLNEVGKVDIEEVHYKTTVDKKIPLIEDSDLFGFSFKTERLENE